MLVHGAHFPTKEKESGVLILLLNPVMPVASIRQHLHLDIQIERSNIMVADLLLPTTTRLKISKLFSKFLRNPCHWEDTYGTWPEMNSIPGLRRMAVPTKL